MGTVRVSDPAGVEVALTDERWQHIVDQHPEMVDHRDDLLETITQPGVVFDYGGHRYYFRQVESKHFGATYLHARAIPNPAYFVVTAWLMPVIRVPEGAQVVWFTLQPRLR